MNTSNNDNPKENNPVHTPMPPQVMDPSQLYHKISLGVEKCLVRDSLVLVSAGSLSRLNTCTMIGMQGRKVLDPLKQIRDVR